METSTLNRISARDELVQEALYDAACDGDGGLDPNALAHHLAKRGDEDDRFRHQANV